MPAGLNKVFFVSGGSEAVESCIKLARQWAVGTGQKKRWKIISREPSYHGGTLGALALTGMTTMTTPFAPMMREMPKVPAPRTYLDRDNLDEEARGLKYAEMLRDRIIEEGPETVLAFIMEPIGGASTGALVAPDSYYARVAEICREFGILLILDEVMTGAGRTGRFMAAEHWNLKPDIVALSKGFASGYMPLGAMVADEKIVEPVLEAGGFVHGYTYAGNPLACAAGLAVLQEIDRLELVERAGRIGAELKLQLEGLMERFPFIGSVRGKGLLLAFELVSDRETMTPLPKKHDAHIHLVEEAYKRGLIIYSRRTRGTEGDHFMVCPPLIADENHIVEIIETLEESLTALAHRFDLPLGGG
jgi:adenosylmethionine-8-amino-7-oxononanoate aminotransferase